MDRILRKNDKLDLLAKALKKEIQNAEGFKESFIKNLSFIAASRCRKKPSISLFFLTRPALASLMIFVSFLIIGFLWLSSTSRHVKKPLISLLPSEKSQTQSDQKELKMNPPLKIHAKKVNSSIMLSWEGSKKDLYKILRSTSPKDFSKAYTILVSGNKWSDPLKNGSHIIYYKIE